MAGATYYKFNMELPMLWVKFQGYDNDKLAEIILSKGDEQDRKTNVKANMTKWRLDLEHKEVGNLADETIKLAKDIRKTFGREYEYVTRSCWGAVYTCHICFDICFSRCKY